MKTEKDATSKIVRPQNVAEYISIQIGLCGKTQAEIAAQAGFEKPNIISMIKKGSTKLPLDKVGNFAKAIGVDAIHLFKLCMQEYQPDTWREIENIINQPVLTANEIEIIETIRRAKVINPQLRTDEEQARLIAFIDSLKGENQ